MNIKSILTKLTLLTLCITSQISAMGAFHQRAINRFERDCQPTLIQQMREIHTSKGKETLCYLADPEITEPELITIYGQLNGDPCATDRYGFNPLHYFAIEKYEVNDTQLEKLKRFIEIGVPLNAPITQGILKDLTPIILLKARMLLFAINNNTTAMTKCVAIQDCMQLKRSIIIKELITHTALATPLMHIILQYSDSELRDDSLQEILEAKEKLFQHRLQE